MLIITLVVVFVVQQCLTYYTTLPVDDWFALSLQGFKQLRLWQLLTFQFMHEGPWPWHLLFNCLRFTSLDARLRKPWAEWRS